MLCLSRIYELIHIDELLFILIFLLCITFICITSSSSIFLLCFFFFPSLIFCLLFKQIKRFLLNMQAIVSSPSHDFTLYCFILFVFVLCVCVCYCERTHVRAMSICVLALTAEDIRARFVIMCSAKMGLTFLVTPTYKCCCPALSSVLTSGTVVVSVVAVVGLAHHNIYKTAVGAI